MTDQEITQHPWTGSRTLWTRLEPRTQDPNLDDVLRAEIHDPAWMLCRQWQVGEFQGEDAGSPVDADISWTSDRLSRFRLGRSDVWKGPQPQAPDVSEDTGSIETSQGIETGSGGPGASSSLPYSPPDEVPQLEEGTVHDYDGEPLEMLVEREAVTTSLQSEDRPPARLRAEAGQQFLRFLADSGYENGSETYTAADFAESDRADGGRFVLTEPEDPLDADGRRFFALADGRALDGYEVYRALTDNVDGIGSGNPTWSGGGGDPPVPQGESITAASQDPSYQEASKYYVAWYADLYDEPPEEAADAWHSDRMEYQFQVSTGPADGSYERTSDDTDNSEAVHSGETVFTAEEYPGGTLDWYSFSQVDGTTLKPPADGDLTEAQSKRFVPSRVRYPGMPVPRWWEFEDASVNLDNLPAGPDELSKLLLLSFSLVHSNDWFVVPLETPVGSLTRITDLTVTDTFGETTSLDAVDDEDWNSFMYHDLPAAEANEPGLLLPPTLGDTLKSDPVERVYFSRDEMANMAFGVEELVESYVGDPLVREEFRGPTIEIEAIAAGADVESESVELHNPGDAPIDLEGWEITAEFVKDGDLTSELLHTFGDIELPADGTVTVHTGSQPASEADADRKVYAAKSPTLWGEKGGSVTVLRAEGTDEDERFVTMETVLRPDESLPDYRLATSVPDHWFPLKPVRPETGDNVRAADTYRLALALLLDADSMDDPLGRIPTPNGRILDTPEPLRMYEEEVTRAGLEVERHYQLARWTDGSTYLWSSRRVSNGRGEANSRLRYDVLSEPDAE